jgi:seryl-tRNA synthetase
LHQFDKVEIVRVEHPDKSYEALDGMVEHVKSILNELKLPYRVLRLCGGDMGFTSALTYDFEVFSTAQDRWLEISSVSNFETFQANRLKLRFKDKVKNQLAHTLKEVLWLCRVFGWNIRKLSNSRRNSNSEVLRIAV